MNLKEILSISGKPGLYKLTAQSRNGVIVESLEDDKRFPSLASQNVSALCDVAIYTRSEELPLEDIFKAIYKKENGGEAMSHKASNKELVAYFLEVVPEFDEERVYISHIKKVLSWYNIMHKNGLITMEEEEAQTAEAPEKSTEKEAE